MPIRATLSMLFASQRRGMLLPLDDVTADYAAMPRLRAMLPPMMRDAIPLLLRHAVIDDISLKPLR